MLPEHSEMLEEHAMTLTKQNQWQPNHVLAGWTDLLRTRYAY